jgi:hypothetical protein
MSNLRLINSTTVASSVSSVNVENVFSSDFDIYKIIVPTMVTVGVSATDIGLRFINSGGSVDSSSSYDYANRGLRAYTTYADQRSASSVYIQKLGQADQQPEGAGFVAYIFNPFQSDRYTFMIHQNSFSFGSGKGGGKGIGVHQDLSSQTGFQLVAISSTRPFDTSTIRTYGIRIDQ